MLFRPTDIVLIGVMVAAAAFTYKTKHEAENRLDAVKRLQSQIQLEQDQIALLRADWSLLTQPAQLQKLSGAFQEELGLQPLEPKQIVGLADIPEKPPVEVDPAAAGDQIAKTGKDATVTGAIAR